MKAGGDQKASPHTLQHSSHIIIDRGDNINPCLAYILWRIYKVHSKLKGFKPVVQMFNDKKLETPNITTLMTNRLHALETRLTSLLSSTATPGTELALPFTSHGPEPPPRKNSLPMVELNVTQQMVQETVKDMDIESSKIRCYKKYLQSRAIDAEKKTNKKPYNRFTKRLCKYFTCT